MCFYHGDYEWTASIVEQGTLTLAKETKCDECHRPIATGQKVITIHMQEHEECQACYLGECECGEEGGCCKCEEPELGESYDYLRCEDCDKFLQAIEAAEKDEGCEGDETRPSLEGMIEDITNAGWNARHEAKRYFKKAVAMFPDLRASGYLAWLWRRMF